MNNYTLAHTPVNNIRSILDNLSLGQLKALNSLIGYFNRFKSVYTSQRRIADKIGYTRTTTNELIKILAEQGLIYKEFRLWMTCLYELPEFFYDLSVRNKLKDILSALAYIPAWKLMSVGISDTKNNINIETLRVATGKFPSATSLDSDMVPEKDSYVIVDSYIAPFVGEIDDVSLTIGEKYELSRWPQAVVSKALWIMRQKDKHPRTFAYLNGICKRIAGSGKRASQPKFRFSADPDTGETYIVNLAEEAEEKKIVDFHTQRQFIADHKATRSDLYDFVMRREFGLPADNKAAAEKELIALGKEGIGVSEFVEYCHEDPEWQLINPQKISLGENHAWNMQSMIYRDTKEIESFAFESDNETVADIIEDIDLYIFENTWNYF